jgi:two-component system copper resistance phosphate regulon response regulator CusR
MRILVIEDDKRIATLVERAFRDSGHHVTLVYDGRDGAEALLKSNFDAALLDIYLPRMDGVEVLEHVRARNCRVPILMLTAVDAVPRILKSFDLGADDYLVKPFIVEILLARVAAIARRGAKPDHGVIDAFGVTLDPARRMAIRHGREIPLTRKQFDLLDTLMRQAGQITSREQLIEAGWGHVAHVKENTLDVYIHGLRAKLENASDEQNPLIQTVHGTGYLFRIG